MFERSAPRPTAVLNVPLFANSASKPIAVLPLDGPVNPCNALCPNAVLELPLVFDFKALFPMAVF
jgi:hypothetical protein